MQASSRDKRVLCFCHFGGDLIKNDENHSMYYKGGQTVGITATSITTFDEFVAEVQKKFGLVDDQVTLKYAVDYNETQLLNLVDEGDLHDLVNFSEKYANIYIFSREEASRDLHHEEQLYTTNYS